MKAIETNYKGYRFRSRLEARWAVFFDALGLQWEYEPEGFDLGHGERYLPDFRVTSPQGLVCWYEVKPKGTTTDRKFVAFQKVLAKAASDKCRDADEASPTGWRGVMPGCEVPQSAHLLAGDPVDQIAAEVGRGAFGHRVRVCPRCGTICETRDPDFDGFDFWFYCWFCDLNTPESSGHPVESGVLAEVRPHKGALRVTEVESMAYVHRVQSAADKARGARFEHGESGARRG